MSTVALFQNHIFDTTFKGFDTKFALHENTYCIIHHFLRISSTFIGLDNTQVKTKL